MMVNPLNQLLSPATFMPSTINAPINQGLSFSSGRPDRRVVLTVRLPSGSLAKATVVRL